MKPAVRIGIALGVVALVLGIGATVTRAVTYRAELYCSPESSTGQTDTVHCKVTGDTKWWASYWSGIPGISKSDCGFTAVFSDDTWTLTRADEGHPDGVLRSYAISGAEVLYYQGHACSSKEEPYTGIQLLSSDEQAPYLSVPNAAGATACGVFDVNGWGAKYVGMGDFPGCTAPVTVMCLNGDGEWTADTVSDVVMHGDWEVDFISSQDGTCGLFEQ